MKKALKKLVTGKGLYYLLAIGILGTLLGANIKWSPP